MVLASTANAAPGTLKLAEYLATLLSLISSMIPCVPLSPPSLYFAKACGSILRPALVEFDPTCVPLIKNLTCPVVAEYWSAR